MIVSYCPRCSGRPYTLERMDVCPLCGATLQSEFVMDDDLMGREMLKPSAYHQFSHENEEDAWGSGYWNDESASDDGRTWEREVGPDTSSGWSSKPPVAEQAKPIEQYHFGWPASTDNKPIEPWSEYDVSPAPNDSSDAWLDPLGSRDEQWNDSAPRRTQSAASPNMVVGKVLNYSNSALEPGDYRRNLLQKLVDALLYGQRTEDIIHRFEVRTGDDDPMGGTYSGVFVNVHGTIASGMQIANNQQVEVHGRYRDGVLMAQKVFILSGVGKTEVSFQHTYGGVAFCGGLAMLAVFALLSLLGDPGSLLSRLYSVLSVWVAMFVISVVLWAFVLSKLGFVGQLLAYKGGKKSVWPILVLSVILTLIVTNAFGVGTAAGSVVDSVLGYLLTMAGPIALIATMLFGLLKMMKP